MHSWENDDVRTFVGEPLNHIHQDTKSARLIAVCKRYLHMKRPLEWLRNCQVIWKHIPGLFVFVFFLVSSEKNEKIGVWREIVFSLTSQ